MLPPMTTPPTSTKKQLLQVLEQVNSDLDILGDQPENSPQLDMVIKNITNYQPTHQASVLHQLKDCATQPGATPDLQHCLLISSFNIHDYAGCYDPINQPGINPYDVLDVLKRLQRELMDAIAAIEFDEHFYKLLNAVGGSVEPSQMNSNHPVISHLLTITHLTSDIIGTKANMPNTEQVDYTLRLLSRLFNDK